MQTYCLVFQAVLPGYNREDFGHTVSKLLGLPPQQITMALSTKGVVLASGLGRKEALLLQGTLIRNGYLCGVEEDKHASARQAAWEKERRVEWMQMGILLLLILLALLSGFAAFGSYFPEGPRSRPALQEDNAALALVSTQVSVNTSPMPWKPI